MVEVRDGGADVGDGARGERKLSGEHDALEQLWEALAMEYEPTLSIKSAIEDGGSGSA